MQDFVQYLAGFFDGEGTISVYRNRKGKYTVLTIAVGQNDPTPLKLFHNIFGGSLFSRVKSSGVIHWVWRASPNVAYNTLKTLRPYLIVKARQADLALEMMDKRRLKRTPQEVIDQQEYYYSEMKRLNNFRVYDIIEA